MHHPDSGVDCVLGGPEVRRCAVDSDVAFVGADHPVDDLHQRRFSGPVLSHDGVNLTRGDRQLDVIVGNYPRIPLGDALELYCGCLSHLPVQIERRAQESGPGAS